MLNERAIVFLAFSTMKATHTHENKRLLMALAIRTIGKNSAQLSELSTKEANFVRKRNTLKTFPAAAARHNNSNTFAFLRMNELGLAHYILPFILYTLNSFPTQSRFFLWYSFVRCQ